MSASNCHLLENKDVWSNIWQSNVQESGGTDVPFTVRPPKGVGGGSSSWELTPVPGLNKPLGVFKKSRMSLYNVQVDKLSKCTIQILENTTLTHWTPFHSNWWKFEERNIIKKIFNSTSVQCNKFRHTHSCHTCIDRSIARKSEFSATSSCFLASYASTCRQGMFVMVFLSLIVRNT